MCESEQLQRTLYRDFAQNAGLFIKYKIRTVELSYEKTLKIIVEKFECNNEKVADEIRKVMREYAGNNKIGLIDGTYVAITNLPKVKEYAYVNRNTFKSINVHGIFDTNIRFLYFNI